VPGITLRTTIHRRISQRNPKSILRRLLSFIERTRFERLGVFSYSQEQGSRAAKMDEQIPQKVKSTRF